MREIESTNSWARDVPPPAPGMVPAITEAEFNARTSAIFQIANIVMNAGDHLTAHPELIFSRAAWDDHFGKVADCIRAKIAVFNPQPSTLPAETD